MTLSPTSWPGSGDSSGLAAVTKTLTDAQVKALPAATLTGFTLVAAQGAGTVILPVSGLLVKYGAAYTNVTAAAFLLVGYSGFNSQDMSAHGSAGGGGFLDTALDETLAIPLTGFGTDMAVPPAQVSPTGQPGPLSALSNLDLVLFADNAGAGNFTGGGAGNSVVVHLLYTVLSV